MNAIAKLVVTDLDNTLLNSNKKISKYSAEVLAKCQENGITIAYASARPISAIRNYVYENFPSFIIANNGANIYDGSGNLIYSNPIEKTLLKEIVCKLLSEDKITKIALQTNNFYYGNDPLISTYPWSKEWCSTFSDFREMPKEDVFKITTHCSEVHILRDIIKSYPKLHLYENSGENWQQIMLDSSTKTNGIKFVIKYLQLDLNDVIAFGDDYNDTQMISMSGIGVAVENAIDEVKKTAHFVCDTNENDGVTKWIEQHLLNNGRNAYVKTS